MNKLVIFDLDGTLLNTIDDIADNINKMLFKFGFPKRSIEEVKQFVGNGARNLVKKSLPNGVSDDKLEELLLAGYALLAEREALNYLNRCEHSRFLLSQKLHKKGHKCKNCIGWRQNADYHGQIRG